MPEITKSRYLVTAGWDDVPHLDESTKVELLASTPPHLRDARSKGIPSLGSGAIYPLEWEKISIPYFPIPPFWPRAYALDVGWNWTAALWCAWDPETWVGHLYAEYKRGEAQPAVHAVAIKARGDWIHGVVDPAAKGRTQDDGDQMMALYENQGLHLTKANNAVDAGIYAVWEALETGRLKVMQHLTSWRAEQMLYRRDEKGHIVKKNDHLMDTTRYIQMSGRAVAKVKPFAGFASAPQSIGDDRAGY